MKNPLSTILIFGALASGAATSLSAADIAIANHSFEAQTVADGQENVNDMTGWIGSGSFFHVSNPADGRFDGTTAGSGQPNPIDGVNIAGINTGATIYQDLAAAVHPGASYKLTMLVGHRRGVPFGAPVVSLIAGGEVLAEATPVAPADGQFSAFELVYDAPATGTVVGQTLRIQLRSAGVNAQSWFDNLKLTETLPPPPSEGSIPIANHSFEDPSLADGHYNVNNTPGWTGSGTWWHVANPRNDWFAGTSPDAGSSNSIDGLNIGGINTGATVHQDLSAVVQPGATYTLTMLTGHRIGVPFGSPIVSLIAGGEILAEAVPVSPASGAFAPFTLTYNSPSNGPAVGQTLRIQLKSVGVNAQAWFDDLRLTFAPAPTPPPPGPDIAIVNHSFEEPVLVDGQYNVNSTPGWTGSGTWWHVANPQNDWFAGTSPDGGGSNPIDGSNIGGINTGAAIHQDLTAVVQPGVTYTLTMLTGHRIGVPFGSPTVRLMAGGEILAEAVPPAPASGTFAPFTLTFDSPTNGTVIGQTLRIQIRSIGTDAQPWFDNLKLVVGPTPPPPSPYIAIANHSFEAQVLADGQYNVNDMTGWLGSGSFFHVANPADDRFDGTSAGSSLPNPIDGANIAGVNTGATIYQDLAAVVQPGVTYTLTLLTGHRRGIPFGAPVVSLIAGGEVLAEGSPDAPADGKFSTFQLTYDSPASGAAVGQTLRIQIRSAGVDAQPWFDNVQLAVGPTAPPPPPPPGPDITIANHSFEEPALADGHYTINNTPGWSGVGTWWHVANLRNDWFRETSAGSSGPNPIDGVNAAGLNTGASIYQDLTATVQPGVTYTLTMLVGHRIGVPFGRPVVSLIAGGQVLAEAVPLSPANGAFAPFTLTYNSPASGAAIGQTIRIQLRSIGVDSQPWFDNLKLVVGPTPPPPVNVAPVAKAIASPLFAVWPDQTNLMVISVNGYSAPVEFDGTLSSDADGDPLSFYWTLDDEGSAFANTAVATNSLTTGLHTVTLLVVDGTDDNAETLELEVITLADAIDEIYGAVIESELQRKDKRPLLATLEGVEDAFDKGRLEAGVRQLRAFQQKVRAQVSGRYPELAERLVDAAGQIAWAINDYIASQNHSPEVGGK